MALNFASMLLQPTKTSAWDLSPGGGSTAREQLALAREQFLWNKKKADEDRKLAREAAAAQATKEALDREGTKAAKLQEDRLKAFADFSKAGGEGNVQAMAAQAPLLQALGMGIELQGETGGLPRYRVDMDAAAAQKAEDAQIARTSPYGEGETAEQSLSRLSAMGLGGELGTLEPPLGIRSSDEVDPATGQTVASRVAATYGAPGEKTATRAPDVEDFTGGVPKNVIDMGAMAASTLHRLNPTLQGMALAYPDEVTQAGAEQVRLGLQKSGLPFEKQVEMFDKAVGGAATQRNAQIAAQAQAERFRETRDQLTEKDKSAMKKEGRAAAEQRAKDDDVTGGIKALRVIDEMEDILSNEGPGSKEDDTMIAGALMSIQDVKGIPSDKDLAFAFGMGKADVITQVLAKIQEVAVGGFSDPQRAAIRNFIRRVRQSQEEKVSAYLDTGNLLGEMNEFEQEGYRGYSKRLVPGYVYNAWREKQPKKEAAAPASGGSEFDKALDTRAREAGFDPDKIRAVTRRESGNQGDAQSSAGAAGVFQLMGDRAREVGTSTEDLLEMTPAEQVPYGVQYLKNTGLKGDAPPRDYALAFAAPAYIGKPDDTVITQYKKGTKRGDQTREQNPGWVPKDGGEITVGSILDFYGLRGATDAGKGKAADKALPEPKTPAEKRYLELLRKRGN